MDDKKEKQIKMTVQALYGQIAAQHTSCCQPPDEASSGDDDDADDISNAALLYSREELAAISTDIPSLGCAAIR